VDEFVVEVILRVGLLGNGTGRLLAEKAGRLLAGGAGRLLAEGAVRYGSCVFEVVVWVSERECVEKKGEYRLGE
jgi:hypothetical protein